MKSVVICGSRRFKPEIRKFAAELKELGVVVYEPYLHKGEDSEEWSAMSGDYKKLVLTGLTLEHFYKIKMADIVFIYNKNGYAGVSTTLEIGGALMFGKPIYALEHDNGELCREVLFRGIVSTPYDLIKFL